MTTFFQLPAEIHLMVIQYFDSAQDFQQMISVSPLLLQFFNKYRTHIFRALHKVMKAKMSDKLIPLAVTRARLRDIRHKHDKVGTTELERRIRPVLEAFPPQDVSEFQEQWLTSLATFRALSSLIQDIDHVVARYAPRALKSPPGCPSVLELKRIHRDPCLASLEDSESERCRLQEAEFRFEIYCLGFFYDEAPLFLRNSNIGMRLAQPLPGNIEISSTKIAKRVQSVWNYVYGQHSIVLANIEDQFRAAETQSSLGVSSSPGDTQEFTEATAILATTSTVSSSLIKHRLRVCRLRHGTTLEVQMFIRYLCSQGTRLIRKMERMNGREQDEFILEAFFRISIKHPGPLLRPGLGSCPVTTRSLRMPWEELAHHN